MTQPAPPTLGTLLRRHRERRGLTQEDLAERAGAELSVRTVRNLERGRTHPYPHTPAALAVALGLSEAEREELLAARATRAAVARALGSAATPALPVPATPLVDREQEVAAVAALLGCSGVRLVTLTGTAGVGKTRLALEVARRVAGAYRDGVWFIDLSAVRDPALVPSVLVRGLGLREEPGRPLADTLLDSLRGREGLLVLDNLEQVLPATPLVGRLLSACPGLVVLATSRVSLRLYGEQEYAVPPLGLPEGADPDAIVASAAVRLFVERAQAVRPGFAVTEANGPMVLEICRRLDGLPLAIELAAARARLFAPGALLARLDSRLGTLTGGARDLPARQQTLRAALDWSYDLLDGGERHIFLQLGVFAGGFDLAAAEAVCDPDGELDVLAGVEALAGQSLVRLDEGDGAEPRFRMLETVREYALTRLMEGGEGEGLRRRHAQYFLDLAERAESELAGPRQAEWLGRLEAEHDNLRAALEWLLAGTHAEKAALLGWYLCWFWFIRGHFAEGRRWMRRVLDAGSMLGPEARARALVTGAALAYQQGDYAEAGEAAAAAAELARGNGASVVLARSLLVGSHAAVGQGNGERAGELAAESARLYRRLGDPSGAGLATCAAVHVAARRDPARAAALLDEAEALLRRAGAPWGLAYALNLRIMLAQLGGDEAATIGSARESIRLSHSLGDTTALLFGLSGLAGALAMTGQGEHAARLFGAADRLRERTGQSMPDQASRSLVERHVAVLHAQLDPRTLAAAWAEGRRLLLEEAVAYALEGPETFTGTEGAVAE